MANHRRVLPRSVSLLLLLLIGLLPACGSNPANDPDATGRQELEDIGQAYRQYLHEKKRAPSGPRDLRSYEPGFATLSQALQSGQYVVVWKANPALTPDAKGTVLAYHKSVPEQGGLVLMLDGQVHRLSAEEFKAAPRASAR